MKKIILLVVLLVLTTFCLTACDSPADYTLLNNMVKASYKEIQIDVSVVANGEKTGLTNILTCKNNDDGSKTITYAMQEYAQFTAGTTIVVPNAQIVTKSGTATVKDGVVTSHTGDQVDLDFTKIGNLAIKFNKSNLKDDKVKNNVYTATVVNGNLFLGASIANCKNMTVSLDYQALNGLTVSYQSNNSTITINYSFVK